MGERLVNQCHKVKLESAQRYPDMEKMEILLDERVECIENRIRSSNSLDQEQKKELFDLIARLMVETKSLYEAHCEDVCSIAGFLERSVQEALRDEKNPALLRHSREGLLLSSRRFEVSHPTLIGLINDISLTLSNIGI
jgi:hypothetical protein